MSKYKYYAKINKIKIKRVINKRAMEKFYFKTEGQEPDINCIQKCNYITKPSKGTKIGSASCQQCQNCFGFDKEENWVKCLEYSLDITVRKIKPLNEWAYYLWFASYAESYP